MLLLEFLCLLLCLVLAYRSFCSSFYSPSSSALFESGLSTFEDVQRLSGEIEFDYPNPRLDSFRGSCSIKHLDVRVEFSYRLMFWDWAFVFHQPWVNLIVWPCQRFPLTIMQSNLYAFWYFPWTYFQIINNDSISSSSL